MKPISMVKIIGLAVLACILHVSTAVAQPVRTNTLDSLRTTCSVAADRIAADTQSRKDAALAQYGKTLGAILNDLKQKGDLDDYKVVEEESKRFQSDKIVLTNAPHAYVANAVAAYQKQVLAIETDAEYRRADLLKQYIAALGRLVKDLMVQDKIDDAKAADVVKSITEYALAITESKLPKASDTAKPSTNSATGVEQSVKRTGRLPLQQGSTVTSDEAQRLVTQLDEISEQQWTGLRGKLVTVSGKPKNECRTGITISQGERYLVIPCPTDRWNTYPASLEDVDWRGHLLRREKARNGMPYMQLCYALDEGRLVSLVDNCIVMGPGKLLLAPSDHEGGGEPGNNTGRIRVKIIKIDH